MSAVPTLGICLGMQLITRGSEEGELPGLGWVGRRGPPIPLLTDSRSRTWDGTAVAMTRESPLTAGLPDDARFYFVHSYYVSTDRAADSVLTADYGVTFAAAIEAGNIYGAQFHPEKSHKFGMQLLANFAGL